MTRGAAMSVLSALVLALCGACDPEPIRDVMSVTSEGRTVTMVACPECEMCARIAQDAKTATVNVSRLRDGNPDEREFARRRDKTVRRVFELMKLAEETGGAEWGEEAAKRWRAGEASPRTVRKDSAEEVLAGECGPVRKVLVRNLTDAVREVVVPFASVGLAGRVEIVDLTERAIPPDGEGSLRVVLPAKGEKLYRLAAGVGTRERSGK